MRLPDVCIARRSRPPGAAGERVRAIAGSAGLARPPAGGACSPGSPSSRVRTVGGAMIVFYNPVSTTRGKQPLPVSLLSLAAVVDGREEWTLVDGNLVDDPAGA